MVDRIEDREGAASEAATTLGVPNLYAAMGIVSRLCAVTDEGVIAADTIANAIANAVRAARR